MTCNKCRSYQPTFICPECYHFNEHILAFYKYCPPDLYLSQVESNLPAKGYVYTGNKLLQKVLKDNTELSVFQTFTDVDYKDFNELGNMKLLMDGKFDVIVLCNETFRLPLQAFGALSCKYLVLRNYLCYSYYLVANMLTFTRTIENVILDFGSTNLGVLGANYQLFVYSVCGFEQGTLGVADLPPEFMIYYQNRQYPVPKAHIMSSLTLQQMLAFSNFDFASYKLIFAALTPAANFLTQLTQIKISICRAVTLSGFIGIKLCSLYNELPSIYTFLLHLNHLIMGLPNIQTVELFTEKNYYFLPVVRFEIYDEALKLKLIQRQKNFQLEPRFDFILTDRENDGVAYNENVFLEMFAYRQMKPETVSGDYISVLQGFNYDYYSMGDEQLHTADLKLASELVSKQCGIFGKLMPPRTVLSLIRRSSRNQWFYIMMFSSRGFCKGVSQFFDRELHDEADLLEFLFEYNYMPRDITFVLLFDYYRKEQLGANSVMAIAQMKPDILNAAFYPHYQDLQMIKFRSGQNLILQGFPEYAQLFTANMYTEIDFLLACIEAYTVVTDCPLVCYFKQLLSDQAKQGAPDYIPLGLSDELFLPMLCQFHYLYPKCAPLHLDLHVEYKIRFHQSSFQLNFSKNKFAQTQTVRNRSFADESTAYDISARVQLFFDMFPSLYSIRVINASSLLLKPHDTANLVVYLALRCETVYFIGLEIGPLLDDLQNGRMHISGKYVKRYLALAAKLYQAVLANQEALVAAKRKAATNLLGLLEIKELTIDRISDRHVFHGAIEAPQFQEFLYALDQILASTNVEVVNMPNALFAPRSSDSAIANIVSLTHLFIAHGVRILRGSFLGNPRAAFLTSILQCCAGKGNSILNIGFINYKASFQILRCETDRLAPNVTYLAFQQFQYADVLCEHAGEITELCARLPKLQRLFFIENGLSQEKYDAFEQMLQQILEYCPAITQVTVIEANFDKKHIRARFPKIRFSFAGDLMVRNGVVLKHYDGIDDIYDVLDIDEEVRLIDSTV